MVKVDDICCDEFKKISQNLKWFHFSEPKNEKEKQLIMMLCVVLHNGELSRVNFCPSYGKDIRMNVINKNDLL